MTTKEADAVSEAMIADGCEFVLRLGNWSGADDIPLMVTSMDFREGRGPAEQYIDGTLAEHAGWKANAMVSAFTGRTVKRLADYAKCATRRVMGGAMLNPEVGDSPPLVQETQVLVGFKTLRAADGVLVVLRNVDGERWNTPAGKMALAIKTAVNGVINAAEFAHFGEFTRSG